MKIIKFLLAALATASVFAQGSAPRKPLVGFSPEGAVRQLELEARFDAGLDRRNLAEWMQQLASRPHHLSSAQGKANAELMVKLFRSWGYEARIETFEVLFPTPKTRILEMTVPERFTARLSEPPVEGDASSAQVAESLPSYNAYSIDGDVAGDVVYVNYGVPADYEELERRGISVKGKIAIARYGGSWRGIKPKVAAEKGAIACLIYSDPRDDGYFNGDTYPAGAYRSEHGVQRGSVADIPVATGDPSTPFVGSTKDVKRVPREKIGTLTKIPVLPISYADALPILRNLGGPVAPAAWRGALPITYKTGGRDALKVRLKLEFDWNIVPLHNVIATIRGSEFPDEWVMRGNHHDSWVHGASDPTSGVVAELEEARGIGMLLKTGWKPRRTIVYALWDGEEQGLIGSTEWAETHAEELKRKAVVYINTDSVGRGFIGMGGSHSLERFINEVVKSVRDPQYDVSVWERARAQRIAAAPVSARKAMSEREDLPIGALGSGSDYTPFLQHLGIASLDLGFGGEGGGGSYHSNYDTIEHFRRFGDFDHAYGFTLSKVSGRAVLRFAQADTLPFVFSNFSATVDQYLSEIERMEKSMMEEDASLAGMLADGTLKVVQNPQDPMRLPAVPTAIGQSDFSRLRAALDRLRAGAARFDALRDRGPASAEINGLLLSAERLLTSEAGLPDRPWYRHQIYAPGFYTGYGVKTLPGIRESMEQRQGERLRKQIGVLAGTIDRYAERIEAAAAKMEGR